MEAAYPAIHTSKPDDKEINLIDFTSELNGKLYNCSLKDINKNKIKLVVILSNCPFRIYEGEFNLKEMQNLNKNFRIYDNINELEDDFISYINQNNIKIINVQKNNITLELKIIAKINNTVDITLNRKENKFQINELDFIYEELEKKNKEIFELKNELIKIEEKRKEELLVKNEEISNLTKRLERLELAFQNFISKGINIENIENNKTKKIIKKLNIQDLQDEFKIITIKTEKPINEICLFPNSGNYIESSCPSIFDKNHNLIISFDDIGFCEHMYILSNNFVILSQKNILLLLRIIDINQKKYKFQTFKNKYKDETIKKIIKGLNQDEIITSDIKGNISFWKMIRKYNDFELCVINFIETKYETNTYLLLLKNILIVGGNKLYLYNIGDSNINSSYSTFDIQPMSWNSMIIINENDNLIGVGCTHTTFILKINGINKIQVIKKINIINENTYYAIFDSLCVFQNSFLILGIRGGDIYFCDINNNFEIIKIIKEAHNINKDSEASINGIAELFDGAFASFGEDNKIKIWYY